MRRLIGAGLVFTLALASAGPASAATPVPVRGSAGWVTTGIGVSSGDRLSVLTTGFVTTAKIPEFIAPGWFISGSGPEGQTSGALCGDVEPFVPPELGECLADDAYFGTLVARVGGVTFAVGATREIVIPDGATGILELAANDFANTFGDNHGQFTVVFG